MSDKHTRSSITIALVEVYKVGPKIINLVLTISFPARSGKELKTRMLKMNLLFEGNPHKYYSIK